MKTIRKPIAVLLAIIVLASGCGQQSAEQNHRYQEDYKAQEAVPEPQVPIPPTAPAPTRTELAATSTFQQNSVKEAWLGFGVSDYVQSINRARAHIRNFGGFVASENEVHSHTITNTVVVRVPNRNFSALMDSLQFMAVERDYRKMRIAKMSARLDELTEQIKNRQEEIALLEAQAKKAKSQDAKYKANSRKQAVQAEIAGARQQLRTLEDQISFSTVTLVMRQLQDAQLAEGPGFGDRMGNGFMSGLSVLGDLAVGIIYHWPLWLVLTALGFLGYRPSQRIRVRSNNSKPSNIHPL